MDGRPNRRNKAAFSNFSGGVVGTDGEGLWGIRCERKL